MSTLEVCEHTQLFSFDKLQRYLLSANPLIASTILRIISQLDLVVPKKISTLFEILKRYSKKISSKL